MDHMLTPEQGIVLDIVFGLQGESRFNNVQSGSAAKYKYILVALRAPKLTAMRRDVNRALRKMAAAGYAPFEICSFKKGDRFYHYDQFPTSLSRETIRKAWVNSGMRELQKRYRRLKAKYKRSH
jgi:hypothetical protein